MISKRVSDLIGLRSTIEKALTLIDRAGLDDIIYIFAHNDADGICSASIIAKILYLLDKPFVIKFIPQLRPDILENLLERIEPREAIFCDLGSGQLKILNEKLRTVSRVLIIDHHIPQKLSYIPFRIIHLNPWRYGFSGDFEASSSSIAYLLARPLAQYYSEEIYSLAKYAIIGSLGDSQDLGPNRSLLGLNNAVRGEAEEKGYLRTRIDIILSGRDSKPLYQALADTFDPFIPGISGTLEGAAKFIISLGLAKGGLDIEKVTINDLTESQKAILVEKIIERISLSYMGKSLLEKVRSKLLGYVYEFPEEKGLTKYGRDFATLLNACGRMGYPGVGFALLLSKKKVYYDEALNIYKKYRYALSSVISSSKNLLKKKGSLIILDGRDRVDESLASPVASILAQSTAESAIILVVSKSTNNYVKISIRRTPELQNIDLRELLKRATVDIREAYYGGHKAAAGAYIPIEKVDEFIERLSDIVNKM